MDRNNDTPHGSPLGDEERAALVQEVRARGLATLARELRVPRTTLANVLAGAAREGSEAVVAARWAEHVEGRDG